jgi:hypothetical protein
MDETDKLDALIEDLLLALEDAKRDLEAAIADRDKTSNEDMSNLICDEIDAINEEIALLEVELEDAREKKLGKIK